ncbi:MAG: sensor histidine kinase [Chloroflexaceae bacterium]|nr:sensor histidine kinase [Chloroflexaceae bacterium]
MNLQKSQTRMEVIGLLPLTVALWLGYVLVLALIDEVFYPHPILSPTYYLVNGMDALLVMGLLFWSRGRDRFETAVVPLVIGLLVLVPIVLLKLPGMRFPPTPASSPESIQLRQMPLLMLALVLTAWQYGWWAVLLFCSGIAMLTMGLHLGVGRPVGAPFWPPVIVLIIQMVSFLVVGYVISALIRRVQQQQHSLTEANARLTVYATTLEELTISRERNRMARELHDTLAHTLSGLSVHLETMKAYWDVNPAAVRAMLDTSLSATRSGLQETRLALKSLRASPLDDLGLLQALRQMVTETAERANLRVNLVLPPQVPPLKSSVEQCLYRVAQEAMANVAHHANARQMAVELAVSGAAVFLRVSDDGCGFIPHQAPSAGHFGLMGMRERAGLVGGTLTITSQPGQGTTVQLSIQSGTRPGVQSSIQSSIQGARL